MKKLILLLLFIPLISFGQDALIVNNHHNEGQKTNYKVSRTEKKNEFEVIKNQSDKKNLTII